ncbi:putative acetyltransferase [Paenibacillus anaericanus]|uniref:GNAT family N-acetyltransferase n=1 Tax=Paenibacillus anaericanus TaxID=170367 RepID=UPI0027836241|nr:GNAT family N-acetyltransferase [Paenibacillus anaericanus]MDQ0089149.1 putative acetyltransferase [Paenibacillus anaericanus]
MNNLKLVKPQIDLKDEYLSFYQEWKESGEDLVPWVISKDPSDFQKMLKFLSDNEMGVGIPEDWVPDSTFWLVNDRNKVIGAVNIRHRLSEYLFNAGGHIGYGIRPSERRKSFATILLKLSLIEAKKLGIKDVLVVCDAGNVGSEKTILNNGGRSDTDYIEDDGNVIKRYWIKNN